MKNPVPALALVVASTCAVSATMGRQPAITTTSSALFNEYAVAADHPQASAAGAEILAAGGNAVDAAVATSFALSVVRPASCGIGGGGFMVIHLTEKHAKGQRDVAINYREVCPQGVGPEFFKDKPERASRLGGAAVGVPGTVAGLLTALEKYGTMTPAQVMAPAIRLAEQGFVADQTHVNAVKSALEKLEKDAGLGKEFSEFAAQLLRGPKGEVITKGGTVFAADQARTLRRIASEGRAGFYSGPVAAAIVDAAKLTGGVLTPADLSGYSVQEMEPLIGSIGKGRRAITMPPPSSGGIVLLQTIGVMQRLKTRLEPTGGMGEHNSTRYVHFLAECFSHSFADRARLLNDPSCSGCPAVDVAMLTSTDLMDDRVRLIESNHRGDAALYGVPAPAGTVGDDGGTSHLSVVDRWGNAVACTETINLEFGSYVCTPQWGVLLNNEMDDFTTHIDRPNAFGLRQSERNLPSPGKRPLSSMTPTIVTDERGVLCVAGGSGGPRIISATVQAVMRVVEFDLSALDATRLPRIHQQWNPDRLEAEKGMFGRDEMSELRELGHKVETAKAGAAVQVIRRTNGGWDAACDPRKGGEPAGK
ncbi:MAG: gamma-glutamyltransferase [Planctomycetes bacterium]|nr:gamma-glutamyltransferase [Planctomycetota bacterium]